MYLLKVEAGFEAGHRLPEYNGPCRRAHGHSYVVQATWKYVGPIAKEGIAIDLVILKRLLQAAVVIYDHQSLNQVMTSVPTAENLARDIYLRLQGKDFGKQLTQVAVEETRGTCVIYRED